MGIPVPEQRWRQKKRKLCAGSYLRKPQAALRAGAAILMRKQDDFPARYQASKPERPE